MLEKCPNCGRMSVDRDLVLKVKKCLWNDCGYRIDEEEKVNCQVCKKCINSNFIAIKHIFPQSNTVEYTCMECYLTEKASEMEYMPDQISIINLGGKFVVRFHIKDEGYNKSVVETFNEVIEIIKDTWKL